MGRQTVTLPVDPREPEPTAIERAAAAVRDGEVVVLPTDTVYGVVCDLRQRSAVEEIYRIKQRRRDRPLALLLRDMSQVSRYAQQVPEMAVRAMQRFWPGPLTVVVPDEGAATEPVRAGRPTVGLRLPAHVVPRLVADRVGGALASTSANRSKGPPPTTAEEALVQLEGLVGLVVDAGPTPLAQESTVVSFAADPPEVLRAGALSVERLEQVLGPLRES
jgi:L-threonylcarbamoyladenylate synthase